MSINRGSIELARSLCFDIAGDEDDNDGRGYGSVDVAEILSAEVVRLRAALAEALAERDAARADLHQLVSDIGREAVLCDTVMTEAVSRELEQIAARIEAAIKQARG